MAAAVLLVTAMAVEAIAMTMRPARVAMVVEVLLVAAMDVVAIGTMLRPARVAMDVEVLLVVEKNLHVARTLLRKIPVSGAISHHAPGGSNRFLSVVNLHPVAIP